MLTVAILDDNLSVLPVIKGAIESQFLSLQINCDIRAFQKAEDLEKTFSSAQYDLFFLDIQMPVDGISFAKEIRTQFPNSDIVFISSREERVFETFDVQPFAFVRKSNFINDIQDTIKRYVEKSKKGDSTLVLSLLSHGKRININADEISYIEGKSSNQMVHYLNPSSEPLLVSSKLEELEKVLLRHSFIRIHKGYLVNFFAISSIGSDLTLTLKDGVKLPISRRKLNFVKAEFLRLSTENGVFLF